MLKLLNEKFHLHLQIRETGRICCHVRSRLRFFYKKQTNFRRRDRKCLFPVDLSLKGYQLVLVKPDIFVSTREAFSFIRPRHPEHSLKEIIKRPVNEWKDNMLNDFEESVFPQYP